MIPGYPKPLNTLGDHLQKRRLDLGLQWKEVAKEIVTDETNIAYWKDDRTRPGLRFWPAIIRFLGYDPRPEPANIGERLIRHRERLGMSRQKMAARLGVDPSTLGKWEQGRRAPDGRFMRTVIVELSEAECISALALVEWPGITKL